MLLEILYFLLTLCYNIFKKFYASKNKIYSCDYHSHRSMTCFEKNIVHSFMDMRYSLGYDDLLYREMVWKSINNLLRDCEYPHMFWYRIQPVIAFWLAGYAQKLSCVKTGIVTMIFI